MFAWRGYFGRRFEALAVKCFVEPAGFRLFKFNFDCSVRIRSDNSVCKAIRKNSPFVRVGRLSCVNCV